MAALTHPIFWQASLLDVVLTPEELKDEAKVRLTQDLLERASQRLEAGSIAWLVVGLFIVATSFAGLVATGAAELRAGDQRRGDASSDSPTYTGA